MTLPNDSRSPGPDPALSPVFPPGEGPEATGEPNPAPTLLDPNAETEALCAEPAELPEVPGYEVLARIGQGGMGVVFRARDLRLNRLVALKMIRDGLLATPAHITRFQGEARAVGRLQHPNIVQIFHVGEQHGRPFLVLELVEGGNLAQRLAAAGPLAPRAAATLVATLARAMHHAHEQGIVHRDLKPANVLLGDGTPKITDFGLAKELEAGLLLSHSASATVLGTPSYMAPEQAWGDRAAVGPPADVYSLGAILYECLTGKPPFLAPSLLEVLDQVRQAEPVPPRRRNAAVPRDLEIICLKCLRKEPGQRYASADDLADDLGRFLRGEPIQARPVGSVERAWKWARRRPAVAVMAALLLLTLTATGFGAWYASRWAQQQQDAARADVQRANYPALLQQAQQALARQRRADARRYLDQCPPDVRGWEWHLLSDQADGHAPPRLSGLKQPVQALAFDPLRHHLYAATESGLRVWDQNTLRELPTLDTGGGVVRDLAISADGQYLAAIVESARAPAGPALRLGPVVPFHWFAPLPGLLQLPSSVRASVGLGSTCLMPGAEVPTPPIGGGPQVLVPSAPATVVVIRPEERRREVRVWALATRRLVGVLQGGSEAGAIFQTPVRLAFHPVASQLAVLGSASARPLGMGWWPGREDDPLACASTLAPARQGADEPPAALGPAAQIAFLDLGGPRQELRVVSLEDEARCLAYSPGGRTLALGTATGRLRLVDPVTGRVQREWQRPEGGDLIALAYDATGRRLATGTSEGQVDLWEAGTGDRLPLLPGHAGAARELRFHPHELRLFSLGQDGLLHVWHLGSGQALSTVRVGSGPHPPALGLDALGDLVAVANTFDAQGGYGLTLLGTRAAGKPAAWQPRPGESPSMVQRRLPRLPDLPPAPAAPVLSERPPPPAEPVPPPPVSPTTQAPAQREEPPVALP